MNGRCTRWLAVGLLLTLSSCAHAPIPSAPLRVDAIDVPAPIEIHLVDVLANERQEPYAPLLRPSGVAALPTGELFLADAGSGVVHIFEPNGSYAGSAEGHPDGPVQPLDLSPHGFKIYLLDGARRQILRYTAEGTYRGVLLDIGGLDPNRPIDPVAMAADRDGRLAIADARNDRVLVTGPFLDVEFELGDHGSLPGQLDDPRGLCFGFEGTIYVADRGNRRIQVFDRAGLPLKASHDLGGVNDTFVAPTDVASDRFGNIFVADPGRSAVIVLAPDLSVLHVIGEDEMADDDIRRPVRCAVSPDGFLFVIDLGREALFVFELVYP